MSLEIVFTLLICRIANGCNRAKFVARVSEWNFTLDHLFTFYMLNAYKLLR